MRNIYNKRRFWLHKWSFIVDKWVNDNNSDNLMDFRKFLFFFFWTFESFIDQMQTKKHKQQDAHIFN